MRKPPTAELVEVKPKDTSRMFAGTLTIQPDDTPKLSYVNMRVMGPKVPMTNSTVPVQPGAGKVLAPPTPVANPATHSAPVPAPSSSPSPNP